MGVCERRGFQRTFLNDIYHVEEQLQSYTCILCGILKWGTCHHGWITRYVDYENSTNRI